MDKRARYKKFAARSTDQVLPVCSSLIPDKQNYSKSNICILKLFISFSLLENNKENLVLIRKIYS